MLTIDLWNCARFCFCRRRARLRIIHLRSLARIFSARFCIIDFCSVRAFGSASDVRVYIYHRSPLLCTLLFLP